MPKDCFPSIWLKRETWSAYKSLSIIVIGSVHTGLLTEFQCNARGSRRMKRQVSENTEPSVKEQRLDADTVFYAGDNHTSSSSPVATRNTHSNMSCKTAVTQVSIYQTNLYLWPSTLTANQIGAQLCFCETTKRFLSCTEEENSQTAP